MGWGYLDILGQKVHRKKIGKTHKDFKLYQVFMFNFLNQNIGIFVLYIYIYILLTGRLNTFCCTSFDKILSGNIGTFWV